MSRDNWDPVTGKYIEPDVPMPAYQRAYQPNSKPAPPERGVVNHEGRAEKFILDSPGRRSEPGAAAAEDRGAPKIKG